MKAIKEESNGSANTVKSKLRYPLRSATKKKDDKSAVTDTASSSPKSGKPQSSVGKSVGFLDISEKDKPAKPTRRLSARAKSSISPLPKSTGTINSSSDSRSKKANKGQRSNEKPVSDVSKSFSRKKFSALSSVSYWLSQIKLSESAVKHSVSLGFFKLALESGCEDFKGTKTCEKCTDPFRFLIWSTGFSFTSICRTCSIDENICQSCLVPFTKPPFKTPWEKYFSRVDFYEVYEPAIPPAADTYKSTSLRGIQLSHGSPDVDNPNIQPRSRFPDYLVIVKDPVYFVDCHETQESKHSCSTTESRSPDH